jgi:hypothetical protein
MTTLHKQTCPTCGQSVNERQIALFKEMVDTLKEVYTWCREHGRHEFSRKDVKHLFRGESVSARFGDWVFFGGLVYKEKKGSYGLNMERCYEFFTNRLSIPTLVLKNPLTDEVEKKEWRTITGIPALSNFLDQNQEFIAKYGDRIRQMTLHA